MNFSKLVNAGFSYSEYVVFNDDYLIAESDKQSELVTMEGECYHKTCFRCAHGGCPLTHSSYAALDGVFYCKRQFAQLFMEKGNYSHVLHAATHRRTACFQFHSFYSTT
ncbi:hypothetical protein Q3G72_007573 [Acer saccharum]|nr:hypothetical protein Q3G72_007573 [Acer saccharum]